MVLAKPKARATTVTEVGAQTVQLEIEGDLPGGYLLRQPLAIAVWREGDEYVAAARAVGVHGFGSDSHAAIDSLRDEIIAYGLRLTEFGDRLSPRLAAERVRLIDLLSVARGELHRGTDRAVPGAKAEGGGTTGWQSPAIRCFR